MEVVKIKENTWAMVEYCHKDLTFEANFELGDILIVEHGYSSRLLCFCTGLCS